MVSNDNSQWIKNQKQHSKTLLERFLIHSFIYVSSFRILLIVLIWILLYGEHTSPQTTNCAEQHASRTLRGTDCGYWVTPPAPYSYLVVTQEWRSQERGENHSWVYTLECKWNSVVVDFPGMSSILLKTPVRPGRCGSVVGASSHKLKGHGFNSWSGHTPGLHV